MLPADPGTPVTTNAARPASPAQRAPEREAFARPKTVQQALLAELRQLIVSGAIPPGAPIRQEEIAERFGLSRIPVREALKMLEGEGYVTYQAHFGYTVTQLSIAELLEIYQIRAWLETGLVRVAVPRFRSGDEEVMRAAMAAMVEAARDGDMQEVSRHNRTFHFQLFLPSRMHRAVDTVRKLWDATDPYRPLYFEELLSPDTINAEHEPLLRAALDTDIEETVRQLDLHRGHSIKRLREHLETTR